MKFKVLLRKRGGARARAAAGAERGAANKMTSESFASSVQYRLYSTEPGREVSSPSRANEWRRRPCHVDARTTRDRREARREAREWRRSREGVRWGTIAAALIDKYSCCGTTDTPACTQSRA